jgi:hypothetical protein
LQDRLNAHNASGALPPLQPAAAPRSRQNLLHRQLAHPARCGGPAGAAGEVRNPLRDPAPTVRDPAHYVLAGSCGGQHQSVQAEASNNKSHKHKQRQGEAICAKHSRRGEARWGSLDAPRCRCHPSFPRRPQRPAAPRWAHYEPKKPHKVARALGVMPRPSGPMIMAEQPHPAPGYLHPPRLSSHRIDCDPPQSFPQSISPPGTVGNGPTDRRRDMRPVCSVRVPAMREDTDSLKHGTM